MDGRIEKILATDKAARDRIAKAKKLAEETKSELDNEVRSLKESAYKKCDESIEKVRKSEKKKIESATEEKKRYNRSVCKQLDKKYEDNAEKWVNSIYKKIISE